MRVALDFKRRKLKHRNTKSPSQGHTDNLDAHPRSTSSTCYVVCQPHSPRRIKTAGALAMTRGGHFPQLLTNPQSKPSGCMVTGWVTRKDILGFGIGYPSKETQKQLPASRTETFPCLRSPPIPALQFQPRSAVETAG